MGSPGPTPTRARSRSTTARSLGLVIFIGMASPGLLGCDRWPSDGTHPAGSGNRGPEAAASCESLSAEQCWVHTEWPPGSRCAVILGTAYDAARRCYDENVPAGCTEASAGCGGAITFASDPAGRTWRVLETCTPAGWTVIHPQEGEYASWPRCEGNGGGPAAAECGALSVEACETDSRCAVITGAAYDEASTCLGARRVVGCGTAGGSTVGTCARDPSGLTWFFPDSRTPRGWNTVPCPPYPRACSTLSP